MSGATLTIGGAFNSHNGIVAVPSSFSGSIGGALNQLLENYLLSLTNSITGGTYAFENNDIAAGPGNDFVTVPASVSGSFEEFTNTDSVGGMTTTSASGPYTVSSGVTDVVVQAPGDVTLAGNGTTNFALFGASSNVNYTQSIGGSASIFAAGGSNAIDITAANVNDTVYSAGNDTVVYNGTGGNDVVNAQGNATTKVFVGGSDAATVTASDNAQVGVLFFERAGGSLDFINNSTQAQTVYSGAYTTAGGTVYAPNSITVNAGAGGGYYDGGRGGNNLLIGGSGAVTLVGGGVGDTLIGSSSQSGFPNYLFGGAGAETLLGAAGSSTNVFQIGVYSPGIGRFQASGLVSTDGSASQYFIIGNTNGETITGSDVATANNVYDILGTPTTSGSSLTITNFGPTSTILLVDSTLGAASDASVYSKTTDASPAGGTDLYLTDGTRVYLQGVGTSHVAISTVPGSGIVAISYQ